MAVYLLTLIGIHFKYLTKINIGAILLYGSRAILRVYGPFLNTSPDGGGTTS